MRCLWVFFAGLFVGAVGCSTTYEEKLLLDFWDKERIEKLDDDKIVAQNADMEQMKKDKKLHIGVLVDVSDQTQGAGKLPDFQAVQKKAERLAYNYLRRINAYRVIALNKGVGETALLSGDDIDGVPFSFLINMKFSLNSEVEKRYDLDEVMYKCSLDWQLIDNRTKKNGLGSNAAPFIKEALTSKNVTMRRIALSSLSGRRHMAGSDLLNVNSRGSELIDIVALI